MLLVLELFQLCRINDIRLEHLKSILRLAQFTT